MLLINILYGIVAENEEDYLDGLLKSLSEDENAQSENKDEEEEQIKEQVREAFEKSNEKSTKFENIYDDEDGNLNDDNIEDSSSSYGGF